MSDAKADAAAARADHTFIFIIFDIVVDVIMTGGRSLCHCHCLVSFCHEMMEAQVLNMIISCDNCMVDRHTLYL